MKNLAIRIKKSLLITVSAVALLGTTTTMADDFKAQWEDADATRQEAAELGYEWRDTEKILNNAMEEYEAGNTDAAMALVAQAKEQSLDAVAQAEREKENWMARVPQ